MKKTLNLVLDLEADLYSKLKNGEPLAVDQVKDMLMKEIEEKYVFKKYKIRVLKEFNKNFLLQEEYNFKDLEELSLNIHKIEEAIQTSGIYRIQFIGAEEEYDVSSYGVFYQTQAIKTLPNSNRLVKDCSDTSPTVKKIYYNTNSVDIEYKKIIDRFIDESQNLFFILEHGFCYEEELARETNDIQNKESCFFTEDNCEETKKDDDISESFKQDAPILEEYEEETFENLIEKMIKGNVELIASKMLEDGYASTHEIEIIKDMIPYTKSVNLITAVINKNQNELFKDYFIQEIEALILSILSNGQNIKLKRFKKIVESEKFSSKARFLEKHNHFIENELGLKDDHLKKRLINGFRIYQDKLSFPTYVSLSNQYDVSENLIKEFTMNYLNKNYIIKGISTLID